MENKWKKLFRIFWTFFKIGPVTFGGGFAMIPLIEKEVVEKRKWLNSEDITDIFALAQSVPGAVAINSATFIGKKIGGVRGAIAAMLGVTLPTFIIVLTLGIAYSLFQNNPKVTAAFLSIRVSIVALIVYAAIKTGKTAMIDKSTFGLFVAGVPILFFIHPLFAILTGAIAGIIVTKIKGKLGLKVKFDKEKETEVHDNDYFIGSGT
ncbi:chromate transporter [Neobacillus cucumis]|uniref:chromate transporter n=1 Tax=Neobacillus cucumis TaxID=1740721 RepID=UPI0018DF15D7|nr:chromate transporter [Neobacillus cucumis]MBI0580040.1 chromate transporter [Neobacillus cucumis]